MIIFGKLNKMQILKSLYGRIEITRGVYEETVVKGVMKGLKDAFIIKDCVDKEDISICDLESKYLSAAKKAEIIYGIDMGEAETIALALQLNRKEAIIDEVAAREAAKAFGIMPVGSLRVLVMAYRHGLISKAGVKECVDTMENSKYRISPQVLIRFWDLLEKVKRK